MRWQGEGGTAFNQCFAAEGLLLSEIVQAHWLKALPAATFQPSFQSTFLDYSLFLITIY